MMRLNDSLCTTPNKLILALIASLPPLACGPSKFNTKPPTTPSSLEEAWTASNDPNLLRANFKTKLDELPLTGRTKARPWADSYWPNFQAGLANRWNDPDYSDPFNYNLNDEAAVRAMSREALSHLSPAEKYDIYMGNFQYPLVKLERSRTSPEDPGWYGLCHGWAPAALNFEEPQPTVLKGPSGIEIPFGSSDIKGLLTLAQQYGTQTRIMGERCNADFSEDPARANDASCRDVNAGSFHIAMSNFLGLLNRGFVAEIARGYEVWNQPAYAFSSKIVSESPDIPQSAATGTKKLVRIATTLRYVPEIGAHWDNPEALPNEENDPALYIEYDLELDENGVIIGGEWLTEDRPDFLWIQAAPRWLGYYAGIHDIYKASVNHEFFE